ncbi:uridine phosphorylase [Basidiobolus meristosporus CBS 931.73]|uniref:Uridine phosphorylase n=1 Tax=Basidiobolus meristosporus CBS 931.73 TaxID=1314790 RepID=A0A1Y1Y993_9FUNG|nr:uridine phosphorylase [Basidiobolus meristosporus CBS 931.73]|eukprot:ORX94589.1 uridine phosphorylase [Basidiobolus meristosporus CBS 931.73]
MVFSNANFPMTSDGRTYHVELKRGECANRVITVGDHARAKRMAKLFDPVPPVFEYTSHRNFYTATGRYKGVPVTVIAIGMGNALVDFFVREVRAVVDGPMCMIRFGSCGSLKGAHVGNFIVPDSAVGIFRNYDYFLPDNEGLLPYMITKPAPADSDVVALLENELTTVFGEEKVHKGLNINADSFYSSQGRIDENFVDHNEDLFDRIDKELPNAVSLEMENFILYHLANCSTTAPLAQKTAKKSISVGSTMMVFADRASNEFIDHSIVPALEMKGGRAVLEAIVKWQPHEDLHSDVGSVWEL